VPVPLAASVGGATVLDDRKGMKSSACVDSPSTVAVLDVPARVPRRVPLVAPDGVTIWTSGSSSSSSKIEGMAATVFFLPLVGLTGGTSSDSEGVVVRPLRIRVAVAAGVGSGVADV